MNPNPDLLAQATASLDATPDLLPLLPALFEGIDALGTDPDLVVELLRPLGLDARTRAIDLGCGKGAVAIALARAFGMRVFGVDAIPEFVAGAAHQAADQGVSHLCTFRTGDLRLPPEAEGTFDGALLMAVGRPFGTLRRTVAAVRERVRPGGFLVIDDAVLADHVAEAPPGHTGYHHRRAALAELCSCGDLVRREIVFSPAEVAAVEGPLQDRLRANAERIAAERPAWAERVQRFVAIQQRAFDTLQEQLVPTMWLIERA